MDDVGCFCVTQRWAEPDRTWRGGWGIATTPTCCSRVACVWRQDVNSKAQSYRGVTVVSVCVGVLQTPQEALGPTCTIHLNVQVTPQAETEEPGPSNVWKLLENIDRVSCVKS